MTVLPGLTNASTQEGTFVLNQENEDDDEEGDEVGFIIWLCIVVLILFFSVWQPVIQPGENNQILINSGNAYQRVTVVPADTNSGELSYVLIVQDPDIKEGEQTDGEQDMAGKNVLKVRVFLKNYQ